MISPGDNGQLYVILFQPTFSRVARAIHNDVSAGRIINYGSQAIAQDFTNQNINPPNANHSDIDPGEESTGSNDEHQLQCGRSPYCSKASDCSASRGGAGRAGCKCIAAQFRRDSWSSTCQIPSLGAISGAHRGLLEGSNASAPVNGVSSVLPNLRDLAGPCNCTYVSHACCTSDSGVVHELQGHRLGDLLPPSANLTCDLGTGGWVTKNTADGMNSAVVSHGLAG